MSAIKAKLRKIEKQLLAEMPLRYKTSATHRGYAVWHNDVLLGTVEFWERRYNLRRVIVVKGWRATRANGEKLYGSSYTAPTREAAARVLANPTLKI